MNRWNFCVLNELNESDSPMDMKIEEQMPAVNYVLPIESEIIHEPEQSNEPTYCICSQVSFGEMIGMVSSFLHLIAINLPV